MGGHLLTDKVIDPEGPDAYLSTAPVRDMVAALRAKDIPCTLSLSAGAFICNQVGYTAMDVVAKNGTNVPVGFIHLPWLPEQAAKYGKIASMELETMFRGVKIAITAFAKAERKRRSKKRK